jgi:Flp pilus assembly pilin Flp
MSSPRTGFFQNADGQGLVEYVLLTAAVAIGLWAVMTTERTVLNARLAAIAAFKSSVTVSSECRSGLSENSDEQTRRCARQPGNDRPSAR